MNVHEKLANIQRNLHAPKTQRNKFGNYDYRSCEDILHAVKPLLEGCSIVITDDIFSCSERVYVKATATISNGNESISSTAFARESIEKKGMDVSQITGSSSSYARKYALNGLLLIDDNKDADSMDNSAKRMDKDASKQSLQKITGSFQKAEESILGADSISDLEEKYKKAVVYYKKYSEKFNVVNEFLDELCKIKDIRKGELNDK